MNPLQAISAVAAVIVPVCTLLWYLLRGEIRTHILELHLSINERFSEVGERVAALEARVIRENPRVRAAS